MRQIHTRQEFVELARELGVRADWHEPDEQEVTVTLRGKSFDNAGFWGEGSAGLPYEEKHLVIKQYGKPVATVNLATLCAWASEPK